MFSFKKPLTALIGLLALVVTIVAMVPRVDDFHLLQEMPS
jgi:hypothetical protein